jgi:hypothetical protein
MNVVENFLPKEKLNLLKNYFESDEVNWNYNSSTVENKSDNNYLFSHIVSDQELNNPNWKELLNLLEKHTGKFKVSRVKVNLYPNQNKQIQHAFHCDPMLQDGSVPKNFVTAILNLTTCNGYTIVKDIKVPSKENELIYFDANTLHCGVTQNDAQTRIVININGEKLND